MDIFTLATSSQDAAAAAGAVAALISILLITVVVMIAISVLICLLIYLPYKEVPVEHQRMTPGMVFLLLIPLFNIIWNFIVFQRIPESFQSYFNAQGRSDMGDCGRSVGMWYAICGVASLIPCVQYIAAPAALVLFIIFLVKIWGYKGQLAVTDQSVPPPAPTA